MVHFLAKTKTIERARLDRLRLKDYTAAVATKGENEMFTGCEPASQAVRLECSQKHSLFPSLYLNLMIDRAMEFADKK